MRGRRDDGYTRYSAIGIDVSKGGFLNIFESERVDFVGDVEFFEDYNDLVCWLVDGVCVVVGCWG